MAPALTHTTTTPELSIEALAQSFAMIIVSEIGDKTFLIAAILAMRHPRLLVFMGAFGSLVLMSILSAAMGHLLPTLIPRTWTQFSAGVLFLVFGAKMMMEARTMREDKMREEMKEAEEEIEEDEAERDGTGVISPRGDGHLIPMEEMEEGGRGLVEREGEGEREREREGERQGERERETERQEHREQEKQVKVGSGIAQGKKASLSEGARNFCSLFLGPVFVQAFILTFLGEWGDRSQIATIALGAAHNVYLVTLGTVVGHGCCTALAVIGGRYVSTKISVKHVTLGGSILFLLFGVIYLYEALAMSSAVEMTIPIPSGEVNVA